MISQSYTTADARLIYASRTKLRKVLGRILTFDFDDESLIREQLRGHARPGIDNRWVDEVAIFHTIEQRVLERGLAIFATEGPVGVALADHDSVARAVGDFGQAFVDR